MRLSLPAKKNKVSTWSSSSCTVSGSLCSPLVSPIIRKGLSSIFFHSSFLSLASSDIAGLPYGSYPSERTWRRWDPPPVDDMVARVAARGHDQRSRSGGVTLTEGAKRG